MDAVNGQQNQLPNNNENKAKNNNEQELFQNSPFPLPDNFDEQSDSQNEEENISPKQNADLNQLPQMTPVHRHSMIPISSCRRNYNCQTFETPNVRQSTHIFDELYQSSVKKRKEHVVQVKETPSKITKSEFNEFLNRSNQVTKNRLLDSQRKQQEREKEENEMRESSRVYKHIVMNKKEIRELTERLTSQTPNPKARARSMRNDVLNSQTPKTVKKHNQIPPKTPCPNRDPEVFKRLYEESTQKKKDDSPKIKRKSKSFMSSKSLSYTNHYEISKINSVFEGIDECSKESILEFCKKLSIIDKVTDDNKMSIIEKEIEKCLLHDNVYSLKAFKDKVIEAVTKNVHTKFHIFVKKQFYISQFNQKEIIKKPKVEESKHTVMKKETFQRLLAPKVVYKKEKVSEQAPVQLISKGSQNILNKSDDKMNIQGMDFLERCKYYEEVRHQSIKKLEEERIEKENEKMQKSQLKLGVMPKFYSRMPVEKEEITVGERPQEKHENELMPKEISNEKSIKGKSHVLLTLKPNGWDESVRRIRLGRLERNELLNALDIRAAPVKNTKLRNYLRNNKSKKQETKKYIDTSADINTNEVDEVLGI